MKMLSEFKKKQSGIIQKFEKPSLMSFTNADFNDIEARLLEMGFIEGAKVEVLHKGMWGGEPIAIRINNNNSMVALRIREASVILVDESCSNA